MNPPIPQRRLDSRPPWQQSLQQVVTDARELLRILGLRPEDVGYSEEAAQCFALKIPREFIGRMRRGDPADPLLRQVLAHRLELEAAPGFTVDPVGEVGCSNPRPGVIHKYHGRILLIVTSTCAVHCRYCFRRHFPYVENANSRKQWRETLEYLRRDDSLTEVILSGGDPLMASDDRLRELVDELAAITHVKRLRIHSRLPVVIPRRVTGELLEVLGSTRLKTVMVVHCNHANEIDAEVASAAHTMREQGVTVLNQAVLLAGVNDTLQAQLDLCERLFAAGVLPYYLHLLDRVAGAAHFDSDESRAIDLHRQMTDRLPGYLVPKLVREIEGAGAKVNVRG